MWKFGSRACTSVSRAILDSMSAVSTNNKDCLSRNPMMRCKSVVNYFCLVRKFNITADFSTLEALFAHFTSANKRTNNCRVRVAKL
jgi:hypothetical protein